MIDIETINGMYLFGKQVKTQEDVANVKVNTKHVLMDQNELQRA